MWSSLYSRNKGAWVALALALVCIAQTTAGLAYTKLSDDRVLTFNDDTRTDAPVSGQGLAGGRWEKLDGTVTDDQDDKYDSVPLETDQYNLVDNTTQWALTNETGETVWKLEDVRLGNTFDATGISLGAGHNYLPWHSATAVDFRSHEAPYNQKGAGQAVMRNGGTAEITSPLYPDGIGRIYFDAVNFSTSIANELKLKIFTDETGWKDGTNATVDVYAYVGGAYNPALSATGTETITLNMTAGGNTNNFYRVVLSDERFVNYRGKARFKIVRTDVQSGETEGMAVIDNVICSYPAMTATIEPQGDYVPGRTGDGESVLGYANAIVEQDNDEVMPHFGMDNPIALAKLTAITNSAVDAPTVSADNVKCRYRWRYLAQQVIGEHTAVTNDTVTATGVDNAKLPRAMLNLPVEGEGFKDMPVKIGAIVLGNNSSTTAEQIQYLSVNVDGTAVNSKILNNSGNYDPGKKHADNSWVQRYEFDPALEVRMDHEYEVTFLDADKIAISQAEGVRVVSTNDTRSVENMALRVNPEDMTGSYKKEYAGLLAQVEYTHEGGFKTVDMDGDEAKTSFTGHDPLAEACTALPGDVEMYYEAEIAAPHYEWVNYACAGAGGVEDLSEAAGTVVCRREGEALNSRGTDYFTRLRDNYTTLRDFIVEVRNVASTNGESGAEAEFRTSFAAESLEWHALLYTATNGTSLGICDVRFLAIDHTGATNYLKVAESDWSEDNYKNWNTTADLRYPLTLSTSVIYAAPGKNDGWMKNVPFDGTTGYLRFKYLEGDLGSIVITRADYQNFNGWNDANRFNAEIFVGTSTETNSLTGVSDAQKTFTSNFSRWDETKRVEYGAWRQTFPKSDIEDEDIDVDFTKKDLLGWKFGPGRYVYPTYGEESDHLALQMKGKGFGWMQYQASEGLSPDGVETVSFKARMAQTFEPSHFARYIGSDFSPTNYTFAARALMDYRGEGHDGQASVSLMAHYTEGVGCYEFRVTQSKSNTSRYRLELLRWNQEGGSMKATSLGYYTRDLSKKLDVSTTGNDLFPAMYISVSNIVDGASTKVHIVAGMQTGGTNSDYAPSAECSSKNYYNVIYNDTDAEKQLTCGKFGAVSANCSGRFNRPTYYPSGARPATDNYSATIDIKPGTAVFGTGQTLEEVVANKYLWYMGGWMERYNENATKWGIRCATDIAQEVVVSLSGAKEGEYTPVITNKVTSFVLKDYNCTVYRPEKQWVHLAVGGETSDPIQTDVVVNYVEIAQWRGESQWLGKAMGNDLKDGDPSNIVFTCGWMHSDLAGNTLELNASRTSYDFEADTSEVASIRSPLFDGANGRGLGLGMVAFSYDECDENVNLLVQIATNTEDAAVNTLNFSNLTFAAEGWVTVTNFTGAALGTSGIASYYIGLHDVTGAVRVVMDPAVVKASQTGDNLQNPDYGKILIKSVTFRDEPGINQTSWWGWNMRTGAFLHEDGDDLMQYLADGAKPRNTGDYGLSVALNNSITDNIDTNVTSNAYIEHQPFVQTPTFAVLDTGRSADVGEIRFKARRYDTSESTEARINLYGYKGGEMTADSNWQYITHFDIAPGVYTNFVHQMKANSGYKAFRLAVIGVAGAKDEMQGGEAHEPPVVRVAFDNVLVAETINPKIRFAQIMAFHTALETTTALDIGTAKREQPLTDERWGVQVEIEPALMAEMIDWTRDETHEPFKVTLYWHEGEEPWGASTNWANKAELVPCTGTGDKYIYRSSEANIDSVIPASEKPGVVQYHLTAEYKFKESGEKVVQELNPAGEWEKPNWYVNLDYNMLYSSQGSSAYTVLDNVRPGNAWINEVNVFGLYDPVMGPKTHGFDNSDYTNQYIEVAIPAETGIDGWTLGVLTMEGSTNTLAEFSSVLSGYGYVSSKKSTSMYEKDGYAFLVVASPSSVDSLTGAGTPDGTWNVNKLSKAGDYTFMSQRDGMDFPGGVYDAAMCPVALQLVRENGIVEHQITLGGTNAFTGVMEDLAYDYSPDKLAKTLRDGATAEGLDSKWISVGYDNGGAPNSLSVLTGCGDVVSDWNNGIVKTPGEANAGQVLPTLEPATGSGVTFYCYVGTNSTDTTSGRLLQSEGTGSGPYTNERITIRAEAEWAGWTNITYAITNWYEIADITTNGVSVLTDADRPVTNSYTLALGNMMKKGTQVEVRAWVRPRTDLAEKYGLTENNSYTEAVMAWLGGGHTLKDADGDGTTAFTNPGQINPSEWKEYPTGASGELSLTEMYWLDMDPTAGDMVFWAGQTDLAVSGATDAQGEPLEDVTLTYYMAISNSADKVWSPYVLRGKTPGEHSQNADDVAIWESVTFQITAKLNNAHYLDNERVPVKWYVFNDSSFDSSHKATVHVEDQHKDGTPGYTAGFGEYPEAGINFKWRIKGTNVLQAPGTL